MHEIDRSAVRRRAPCRRHARRRRAPPTRSGRRRCAAEERPSQPRGPVARRVVSDARRLRGRAGAGRAAALNDAQYGQFVTRLKSCRRRGGGTSRPATRSSRSCGSSRARRPRRRDENGIRERLKALRDHDDRAAAELRRAYDALDEVLDVRQQARFRMFEEMHRAAQARPAHARARRPRARGQRQRDRQRR